MDGKIPVIRYCQVISIDDNTDADRIKVRLSPEDNSKSMDEIDYAFPLLPKLLHVKPKVGEGVLVLLSVTNDGNSQRYYIGPVISQDHRLYKDNFFAGGDSFLRGAFKKFDVAPRMLPNMDGLLPNDNDIVIRGRKNSEIQITDDDVRIKAGVKVLNDSNEYEMNFNTKQPAYMKLKYHQDNLNDDSKSTATVVADKIFLLSPSSNYQYNLTDRKDLITDDEMNKIIESAYKLPYGEKLVEFLQTFVNAFVKHSHPYPMLPPCATYTTDLLAQKTDLLDKEQLLSNTARLN
jgi:hypothetical protein